MPYGSHEPASADKRTAAFEDIFGRPSLSSKSSFSGTPAQPPRRAQGSLPPNQNTNVRPSYMQNPRWNYPMGAPPAHPAPHGPPAGYEPYRAQSQPSLPGAARAREAIRHASVSPHAPPARHPPAPQTPAVPVTRTRMYGSVSNSSAPVPPPITRHASAAVASADAGLAAEPIRSVSAGMGLMAIQDTPPSIPKSVVMQQGHFMDSVFPGIGTSGSPAPSMTDSSRGGSSSSMGIQATSSTASLVSQPGHTDGRLTIPANAEPSADWNFDFGAPDDSAAPTTELGDDTRSLNGGEFASLPVRVRPSSDPKMQALSSAARTNYAANGTGFDTPVALSQLRDTGAGMDAVLRSNASSPTAVPPDATSIISRKSSRASLAPIIVPSGQSNLNSATSPVARRSRTVANPALLSEVARAFVQSINTAEQTKDGLSYSDAFDGRHAVDRLAAIIRTSDRNLALLLGRALDAQKLFHDVTYDHRLRDSAKELYQFRWQHGQGGHFLGDGSDATLVDSQVLSSRSSMRSVTSRRDSSHSAMNANLAPMSKLAPDDEHDMDTTMTTEMGDSRVFDDERFMSGAPKRAPGVPTGVFTLLTPCYSPTCSRNTPCYSIACPRHLDPQARVHMVPQPVVDAGEVQESAVDISSQLWAESVPKEVYESVPERERKRQEVIFEIIATERGFVHDLEYLRDFWIQPLSTQHIINRGQRAAFVKTLFFNILDILAVNHRVSELLTRRQKQRPVIECIGDIYLDMVGEFEPFVQYGANQMYARHKLETEKSTNPFFALFVEDTERKAESRKLELNGYLTKPTTRLARYPLLFEQMLKYTNDENPDKTLLPLVIQKIKALLSRVNHETGRSENRMQLTQLSQQLFFKPGETVDLRLGDDERELVFKGTLKKRSGTQSDNADIHLYLFDHALLMVKHKIVHKNDLLKVYRKPIPLELLQVTVYEDVPTGKGNATRTKSVMSRSSIGKRTSIGPSPGQPTSKQDAKTGYAITFTCLGKKGYSLTLWASTVVSREKWFEHIEARQEVLRNRSTVFDIVPLSTMVDIPSNRITCAVPFDFGRQIIYGKDDGVYLSDLRAGAQPPVKVLPLIGVTQVDVLEEHQILIVLAEQSVYTFTLDALDSADPVGSLKRGRRISSHTTFFRAGVCMGRTLVCVVKSGPLSSTIKTLEPIEQNVRFKKQPTFRKLLQGGQDTLRVFKEFYIPTESSSIHFLKSKLCVGTTKGFEIVDLETLDTQGLLDPADTSLDFVQRRENVKPVAIYRIDGEFLLCYNEFAFYVNKNGWRSKGNWIINWEGNPTSFALHHPYVLAFEPNFVEVRHVDTGALHQVITGHNLHCIFADSINASLGSNRSAARSQVGKVVFPGRHASMAPFAAPGLPYSPTPVEAFGPASPTSSVPPQFGRGSVSGSPVPNSPYTQGFVSPPPMAGVPGMPRPSIPAYGIQSPTSGASSPKPQNPVLESVIASRNHIVFVGDSSVYSVRLHNAIPPAP